MADKEMTICSTMFCYNDAEVTNDPSKPPFCDECKYDLKKKKENNGSTAAPEGSSDSTE